MHFEKLVLNTLSDMVLFVDRDLRVHWANKTALEVLGRQADEVIGQRCHELWHQRAEMCTGCPVRQALESGQLQQGEVSDAEGRRWMIRAHPVSEGDEIIGATEVAVDVTESRRAVRALRESEERYRTLVETSPDGITLTDLEGRFITANGQAARLYGCDSVEEFLALAGDRKAYEFIVAEDRPKALEKARLTLEQGSVRNIEYSLIRKDGTHYPTEISASLLRDAEGKPQGFIGVIRDISERQRADGERRQLQAQILHAQKLESLGVLAGGIAHDFNNLLMGILGNASLLLRALPPEMAAREYAERIERTGEHAAELTKQLLAYSGKGEFSLEVLDLSALVEEMGQLLRVSISKKATLRWELTRGLPPVEGDPSQLRQVVMNLITNASEALADDDGVVSITTGSVRADRAYLSSSFGEEQLPEGAYVYLEVSDTGCGMDEATRERIFDPFFSTKFTGRGLGLAATIGIVRRHHGAIRVYSEIGRGSTVKVLLPAIMGSTPRDGTPLPTLAASTGDATILVIDDEPVVREVVRSMLEASGFVVLEAEDGLQGVQLFKERADEIDAVLLDVTMPQMDGAETFAELRRHRPDVKVILSSGYNEQSATSRFMGKGLIGFIQKPYCTDDILATLQRALGR